MSRAGPEYGLKVFKQFDMPRITHVSISTELNGATTTLPVTRAGICRCHAGGMGWWEIVHKVSEDLMICKFCGAQWRRGTDFGTQRWTLVDAYVIEEEP
jgi:hypothetical protein